MRLPRQQPRGAACGALGVQMNLFSRLFRVARSYANALGATALLPVSLLQADPATVHACMASQQAVCHKVAMSACMERKCRKVLLD